MLRLAPFLYILDDLDKASNDTNNSGKNGDDCDRSHDGCPSSTWFELAKGTTNLSLTAQ